VSESAARQAAGDQGTALIAADPQVLPPARDHAAALGARNSRLLFAGVVCYAGILSGLMIARGVAVTPDVLLVGFGLAAVVLGRGRLFLRDWVPFIALFFAYELMRGYADDLGVAVHVTDVIDLERLVSFGYLPTQVLQGWLHPATGVDLIAVMATVVYFLHFPLPLATGFLLWLKRRVLYYDFVAALILLCLTGFVTYLLLPVAPPWLAAQQGYLNGPDGRPVIDYLKPGAFDTLASAFGFNGSYVYSYAFYQIGPNPVAAFPSLHAGFPFLAFLYARRAFGRPGWLVLGYFLLVCFAIVYLAEHYVVDAIAGVGYAAVAYAVVSHAPARLQRLFARARDDELEPDVTPAAAGSSGAVRLVREWRSAVAWRGVGAGLLAAVAGAGGLAWLAARGESTSPLYLVPAALLLGGLWRASVALVRR
jgi:hypothetical protein